MNKYLIIYELLTGGYGADFINSKQQLAQFATIDLDFFQALIKTLEKLSNFRTQEEKKALVETLLSVKKANYATEVLKKQLKELKRTLYELSQGKTARPYVARFKNDNDRTDAIRRYDDYVKRAANYHMPFYGEPLSYSFDRQRDLDLERFIKLNEETSEGNFYLPYRAEHLPLYKCSVIAALGSEETFDLERIKEKISFDWNFYTTNIKPLLEVNWQARCNGALTIKDTEATYVKITCVRKDIDTAYLSYSNKCERELNNATDENFKKYLKTQFKVLVVREYQQKGNKPQNIDINKVIRELDVMMKHYFNGKSAFQSFLNDPSNTKFLEDTPKANLLYREIKEMLFRGEDITLKIQELKTMINELKVVYSNYKQFLVKIDNLKQRLCFDLERLYQLSEFVATALMLWSNGMLTAQSVNNLITGITFTDSSKDDRLVENNLSKFRKYKVCIKKGSNSSLENSKWYFVSYICGYKCFIYSLDFRGEYSESVISFSELKQNFIPLGEFLEKGNANVEDVTNNYLSTLFSVDIKHFRYYLLQVSNDIHLECFHTKGNLICDDENDGNTIRSFLQSSLNKGLCNMKAPEDIRTLRDTINTQLSDVFTTHISRYMQMYENTIRALLDLNPIQLQRFTSSSSQDFRHKL